MADIEVVIKIPEKMYKWANDVNKFSDDWGISDFIDLVKSGTPLPKGHGKLIDISELLTVTDIREDGSEVTYVLYDDIENADTIIEADGGGVKHGQKGSYKVAINHESEP